VIFHGNGAMSNEIAISGVLGKAAQKYRVIVFDRPGYGYSERPRTTLWNPSAQARLFHHALQNMGVEKPIVVGHSWGAMIAVAYGLDYAADVHSLVLLSGYYYPTPRLDVPLFSPPAIPILGDLMRYTVSPIIGRMLWPLTLRKMFYPNKPTTHFKHDYPAWMSLRPSQVRASASETAMMIPAAWRLAKRYHTLRVPAVLLAGKGDLQALARLHTERLHRELPNSELILKSDAGHMVTHTSPDSIVAAIDKAAGMQSEAFVMPPPSAKEKAPSRVYNMASV
jgi:pimeloyl-ACP methyl ester carboxylesterase